ncbi:hypothetical protein ACFPM0_17745 [Pseudonocardia sulfidoxydans]|uniref:hypothetical protein n=1 Tax=Pseudonocardia sulfidoxydans TaxID=54011 RepID=UPI00360F50D7
MARWSSVADTGPSQRPSTPTQRSRRPASSPETPGVNSRPDGPVSARSRAGRCDRARRCPVAPVLANHCGSGSRAGQDVGTTRVNARVAVSATSTTTTM